jgi:hypothetical protein
MTGEAVVHDHRPVVRKGRANTPRNPKVDLRSYAEAIGDLGTPGQGYPASLDEPTRLMRSLDTRFSS